MSEIHLKPSINSSLKTCKQALDSNRELKNGKKNDAACTSIKNKNSSSDGSRAMNSPEANENEGPEIRAITEEEIDEPINSFIAPLTRQLEDLTRLVQGMITASHPDYHSMAGTMAS